MGNLNLKRGMVLEEFDICIVGSGAGASPIAYELSKAGAKVCVLEKGAFYKRDDFSKDEIAFCTREILTPDINKEYQIIERFEEDRWQSFTPQNSSENFWNGSLVGGSSNLMGGFFHRMHPKDFKLLTHFGKVEGANIANWPITYDEMEPYYTKVEKVVGISGRFEPFKYEPPRSKKDFPYPPLKEHPISKILDKKIKKLNLTPLNLPRAILSTNKKDRDSCYFSNFCSSYGCSSGAKGSALEALLNPALKTKNLTIKPLCHVTKLIKGKNNLIKEAIYIDKLAKKEKKIKAKIFVVAAQASESVRLLLNSNLANSSGELGKNFLFGGIGGLAYAKVTKDFMPLQDLMIRGLFINRTIKDFYFLDDGKSKGGVLDFLFSNQNPIYRAHFQAFDDDFNPIYGKDLQKRLKFEFLEQKQLNIEVFNDFLPHDNCFVTVDKNHKDIFKMPVAKIRVSTHKKTYEVAKRLTLKAVDILKGIGIDKRYIGAKIQPFHPPKNLQAGGCRFGDDPKKSVLNRFCQSFDHQNLFVTDGSFMPTGGSVPFTWTIYANSFRVAEYIKSL